MSTEVINTKKRILTEATELFCQNSFDHVTIKDICKQARCNIAAINYHFQDKKGLYCAILELAYHEAIQHFSLISKDLSALEKINIILDLRLDSALFPQPKHTIYRVINQELQSPSPVRDLVDQKYLEPLFENVSKIVADFLGPKATALEIRMAAFSIRSQCIGIHMIKIQNSEFWQPHTSEEVKEETQNLIINTLINYKAKIGSKNE